MKSIDEATRLINFFNRLRRWAIAGYFTGFGIILAAMFIPMSESHAAPLAGSAIMLMVVSVGVHTGSIIARDNVALGRNPWQFSLRTLLIATALIAVALGLAVYAARK